MLIRLDIWFNTVTHTANVLGGNRTLDNLIKSQVLYRLSYKHTGGIGPLWVGYSRCASHTNAAYGYLNCNTRGKPSTHLKHMTYNTHPKVDPILQYYAVIPLLTTVYILLVLSPNNMLVSYNFILRKLYIHILHKQDVPFCILLHFSNLQ